MTTTIMPPAPGHSPHSAQPEDQPAGNTVSRYRRQAARRRLASDALTVVAWLSVAIPVAIWLADGGWAAMTASGAGVLTGLGILAGLVGTSSMILMLWLAARVPVIDRTLGLDKALCLHADLGQYTVVALLLHGLFLVSGYALSDQTSWWGEFAVLWPNGDFALAVVAMVALGVVAVSSVVAARRRLGHEVWQGIHLLTYAAVLMSLPHQFTLGGLFDDGAAFWFWSLLWTATFFVLLTFRVFTPLATSLEHRLRVTRISSEHPDTISIDVSGRHLDRLGARAGHFFTWRFLAPGLWWHQHPFSLSAAPAGDTLRITVRALGQGTEQLIRTLRPGTPVLIEGPYGAFTDASRTSANVVLVGIGIGVAPIRALLEGTQCAPGRATVILRAGDLEDIAHLGEIDRLCRAKGARLIVLLGHRGTRIDGSTTWLPQTHAGLGLADLTGSLEDTDVYVCGPQPAADLVLTEARAAGVRPDQLHNERFSW